MLLLTECFGGWWRRVFEVSDKDINFRTALGLSVPRIRQKIEGERGKADISK